MSGWYFAFISRLLDSKGASPENDTATGEDENATNDTATREKESPADEHLMTLMFCYDIWSNAPAEMGFSSLKEALQEIRSNRTMTREIRQVLNVLMDQIDFEEKPFDPGYPCPLHLHACYNRDQVFP